jgi:ADP-heptose:LPS heptosyltransferase
MPLDLGSSALLTDEVTELCGVHEVERGAEVLRRAGLLTSPVSMDEPSPSLIAVANSPDARAFISAYPELSQAYFIISPGASNPRKEWPEAKYVSLARRVASIHGWTPVIVGGSDVRPAASRIAAQLGARALNLAGETDFPQLAALSLGAQAFFGNDSGTGHVAGALGTPAVIISSYPKSSPLVHQTSPARTHPAGPWFAMVQPAYPLAPCEIECEVNETHCIQQVEVDDVLAAFNDLLARKADIGEAVSAFTA